MGSNINWKQPENLTLLTDFYELTMANGFLKSGYGKKIVYFNMFFRKVPDHGGFAIMAGVQQMIEYLKALKFTEEDIEFLREKEIFGKEFLEYLLHFQFECDVWCVEEGTPIFPNEPIVKVRGPIIQAQLIETMILLTINHQSLIATKANRIVRAAQDRPVLEFGARRAQGYDGSLFGARASYIGGCAATSCTLAERIFNIPASGTMAHSWVQFFSSEYEAFKAYAKTYPNQFIPLVDTYNVLKSGIPNAMKVAKEVLVPNGFKLKGVRIDSGDMTYLSKEVRKMLDEQGFVDTEIIASNSLDEYIIRDLIIQGAKIDKFGVGERLVTSKSEPVFGGVYKLVAIVEEDGTITPKIKVSENIEKITNPSAQEVYRLYDKNTQKAIADIITMEEEKIEETKPYTLFDPLHTWKRKTVSNFTARKLLVQVFEKGNCIYESPDAHQIKRYCKEQMDTLWEEILRFENPHKYYVDLSKGMWELKMELLNQHNYNK